MNNINRNSINTNRDKVIFNNPNYNSLCRTDLALEQREQSEREGKKLNGVIVTEYTEPESRIQVTVVEITNAEGEKALSKPIGTYITLADGCICKNKDSDIQLAGMLIGRFLKKLLPKSCRTLLVAGLGNKDMTADALGPLTASKLTVNRHLKDEKENNEMNNSNNEPDEQQYLCSIVPGVMGQTGFETYDILKGLIRQTKPDAMLVIDALAARNAHRLCSTIQLCNTGIEPGSGVMNHRKSLTKKTLGIPVLSIGVPTVVGALTLAYETLDGITDILAKNSPSAAASIQSFSPDEQLALLSEILPSSVSGMFVTPKDIDTRIDLLSSMISEGIHSYIYRV